MSALHLSIVFGLMAMVGYGLNDVFSRRPSRELWALPTMFYRNVFVVLITIVTFFVFSEDWARDGKFILLCMGLSVVGYFPPVFLLRAFRKGNVSVIAPLSKAYLLIVIIVSVMFLWEVMTLPKVLGMIGIIAGIVMVSIWGTRNPVPWEKWWWLDVTIAIILWWVFFSLIGFIAQKLEAVQLALLIESTILGCAFIELLVRWDIKQIKLPKQSTKTLGYLFLMWLFWAIGTIWFSYGAKIGTYYSLVATLAASAPVVAVIWAGIVYKEKLNLRQYFAVALIVASTIIISYLG